MSDYPIGYGQGISREEYEEQSANIEAGLNADGSEVEYDEDEFTVCGAQVQIDRSGVGHCWKSIDRDDIPASIVLEIECEIIDGGKDSCADYVASNGQHYRW